MAFFLFFLLLSIFCSQSTPVVSESVPMPSSGAPMLSHPSVPSLDSKPINEAEVALLFRLEESLDDLVVGIERARDQNEDGELERLIGKFRLLKLQICCIDPTHKIGCP